MLCDVTSNTLEGKCFSGFYANDRFTASSFPEPDSVYVTWISPVFVELNLFSSLHTTIKAQRSHSSERCSGCIVFEREEVSTEALKQVINL